MTPTIFPNTDAFVALNAQRIAGKLTATELYNAQWALAVEQGIKTHDEMMDDYARLPYTSACGKYDYHGTELQEDCKYSEAFVCLEDAIKAHEQNKSYPWSRIELRDGDFIYEIEPTRTHRLREHGDGVKRYDPCDSDGAFFNRD